MDFYRDMRQCPATSLGPASAFMTLMTNVLIGSYCNISAPSMWPDDYASRALLLGLPTYDFIVVGAGAAGSVVANRLSENPKWKVLLLEAGDNPSIESEIPALGPTILGTKDDWQFEGEPSPNIGLGLTGGIRYPRGRMLGGSTGLNFMYYARGNSRDYNNWAAAGNPTWDWESVLPYFRKSENMIDPAFLQAYGGKYHSSGGLLNVDTFHYEHPIKDLLYEAQEEAGITRRVDLHSVDFIGTTAFAGTIAYGSRQSTAKCFLSSADGRRNLHIIKNAFVTSLEIGVSGHVTGVNFILNGLVKMTARASREYILSAGVFGSAKILMLSGIGPAEHIRSLGIRVQRDLQVGRNLGDHAGCIQVFQVPSDESASELDSFYEATEYLLERRGPFSTLNDMSTFINVNNDSTIYPDTELIYFIFNRNQILETIGALTTFGYDSSITSVDSPIVRAVMNSSLLISLVATLNPKSRGRVELRSRNPLDPPRIIPGIFDNPDDIRTVSRAFRVQRGFLNSPAFRNRGVTEVIFDPPRCRGRDRNSDEFLECWIRYYGVSIYHPTGTCKMGPMQDRTAVVDPRLRVYGFDNLRVIDNSIMPSIVSANTMAATIMIGEKGADFIKADWNYTITTDVNVND